MPCEQMAAQPCGPALTSLPSLCLCRETRFGGSGCEAGPANRIGLDLDKMVVVWEH